MRHAGVAAVAIEPVAAGTAPTAAVGPTVAVYRGGNVTQ